MLNVMRGRNTLASIDSDFAKEETQGLNFQGTIKFCGDFGNVGVYPGSRTSRKFCMCYTVEVARSSNIYVRQHTNPTPSSLFVFIRKTKTSSKVFALNSIRNKSIKLPYEVI